MYFFTIETQKAVFVVRKAKLGNVRIAHKHEVTKYSKASGSHENNHVGRMDE